MSDPKFWVDQLKLLEPFTFPTYLDFVKPLGLAVEASTGIYHLIPMAQSAHESANGNSGLARNHGNLFGIVATDSWKAKQGLIADMPTWEEVHISEKAYPDWSAKNASFAPQVIGTFPDPVSGATMNKVKITLHREFRAYPDWGASFADWAHLITTLSVYKNAYALMKDKTTAMDGIAEMAKVYATDSAYSKLVTAALAAAISLEGQTK